MATIELRDPGGVTILLSSGASLITGTSAGSATVTGTLTGTGALSSTAAGAATTAATLTGTGALDGSAAGSAAEAATLTGTGALGGTAAGSGTASGDIVEAGKITGSCAGTSTCSGDLIGIGEDAGGGITRKRQTSRFRESLTRRGYTVYMHGHAAGMCYAVGTLDQLFSPILIDRAVPGIALYSRSLISLPQVTVQISTADADLRSSAAHTVEISDQTVQRVVLAAKSALQVESAEVADPGDGVELTARSKGTG
jgi:hypothetical protein